MLTKTVTVSNKNQITLPAEYVRLLGLNDSRKLRIIINGKELVAKPEISAQERMKKQWKKLPHFSGTKNDEDLKQVIRETASVKII